MGTTTGISWTDSTLNPWWGCTKISPGCKHCYADAFATRIGHGGNGSKLKIWGDDAARKPASENVWRDPLKWNAAALRDGERRRVFCASMCDVFEDRPDVVPLRDRLFRLIEQCTALDWQLLTKRPENMVRLAKDAGWSGEWPSHVWAGTTLEDQKHADLRLPHLMAVPCRTRFASYEPALELVDFTPWLTRVDNLDWIIYGGESGAGARQGDARWAQSVVRQCRAGGIAPFVKQMGKSSLGLDGTPMKLLDSHGADWNAWPEQLRVREFPRSAS